MSPRRYVALVLAVAGVVWLLVNKQFGEGPMLWHVAEGHALMLTDIVTLATWVAAACVVGVASARTEVGEPKPGDTTRLVVAVAERT